MIYACTIVLTQIIALIYQIKRKVCLMLIAYTLFWQVLCKHPSASPYPSIPYFRPLKIKGMLQWLRLLALRLSHWFYLVLPKVIVVLLVILHLYNGNNSIYERIVLLLFIFFLYIPSSVKGRWRGGHFDPVILSPILWTWLLGPPVQNPRYLGVPAMLEG